MGWAHVSIRIPCPSPEDCRIYSHPSMLPCRRCWDDHDSLLFSGMHLFLANKCLSVHNLCRNAQDKARMSLAGPCSFVCVQSANHGHSCMCTYSVPLMQYARQLAECAAAQIAAMRSAASASAAVGSHALPTKRAGAGAVPSTSSAQCATPITRKVTAAGNSSCISALCTFVTLCGLHMRQQPCEDCSILMGADTAEC